MGVNWPRHVCSVRIPWSSFWPATSQNIIGFPRIWANSFGSPRAPLTSKDCSCVPRVRNHTITWCLAMAVGSKSSAKRRDTRIIPARQDFTGVAAYLARSNCRSAWIHALHCDLGDRPDRYCRPGGRLFPGWAHAQPGNPAEPIQRVCDARSHPGQLCSFYGLFFWTANWGVSPSWWSGGRRAAIPD